VEQYQHWFAFQICLLSCAYLFFSPTGRKKRPRLESFAKRAAAFESQRQPWAGPLFVPERMCFVSQKLGGSLTHGWHPQPRGSRAAERGAVLALVAAVATATWVARTTQGHLTADAPQHSSRSLG